MKGVIRRSDKVAIFDEIVDIFYENSPNPIILGNDPNFIVNSCNSKHSSRENVPEVICSDSNEAVGDDRDLKVYHGH